MQQPVRRDDLLKQAGENRLWDVIVIGGGATGLGAALESQSRGYRTLLLEAEDFAKATSSRSTKLVHGGVRYLQQGNVKLVLEALAERARMLANAPHLAHRRAFIIPAYEYWQLPFYGIGLKAYDLLAGTHGIGRSRILSRRETLQHLPTVHADGLKGGILYYDGQFDDARYAIALLRTFLDLGGVALNYAPATGVMKENTRVAGVTAMDRESSATLEVRARAVVNATGIFSDSIRCMDNPAAKPILSVSQGSHVVLPRSFLPGDAALMIPKTSDGRVLFAIPWHDSLVVGTTDDPVQRPEYDPRPMPDEHRFLLEHIERYLGRKPCEADIRSTWSGQRPLVRQAGAESTAAISRDHTILVSDSGLLTITGGKWTTYRRMGEHVIDRAAQVRGLTSAPSKTRNLKLHGWQQRPTEADAPWLAVYGADLPELQHLAIEDASLAAPLAADAAYTAAEVVWAARYEMARTVDDVLARRTRALFLDSRAAIAAAPETARLLAAELGRDGRWQQEQVESFRRIADNYVWRT